MGTTPKVDKKPKYNQDDKFRWVDSQWEKFMSEQKELKDKIEKLELRVDSLPCFENVGADCKIR